MKEYKASMGLTVRIITICVVVLFVGLSCNSVFQLINSNFNWHQIIIHSSTLLPFIGLLLLSYVLAPYKYIVEDDTLIICRPISNVHIPVGSINQIRLIEKAEMKGLIRTFGNGGLFGIYGKFYSKALGSVTSYATQNKNYILVLAGKRKFVLTPNDLELVAEIKK